MCLEFGRCQQCGETFPPARSKHVTRKHWANRHINMLNDAVSNEPVDTGKTEASRYVIHANVWWYLQIWPTSWQPCRIAIGVYSKTCCSGVKFTVMYRAEFTIILSADVPKDRRVPHSTSLCHSDETEHDIAHVWQPVALDSAAHSFPMGTGHKETLRTRCFTHHMDCPQTKLEVTRSGSIS
jgi:hypothetical protein